MLHMDILLLIYHFARFGAGNVLEIGPYVGGSTIAAAFGARESGTQKKIITIEVGGSVKHFRLSSRNIINDLKKNLARFGVAEDVTLINGRFSDQAIVIDDYFGPAKAAPLRAQVDVLVSEGRLAPFGYYGWGTWVGQWQRN